MEEGQTEQTARALEQARQAARDALDKATQNPTDANRQALEQRLRELEQAIERHMQALMQEAQRNHEVQPFDPDARQLSDRDLEQMAERAREAAKQGRMDEAQRRMAELERMLDELRNAHGRAGQQNQGDSRRQKGRQQMGAVQDMIGREGGLLDHAERRVDQTMRFTPPQPPPVRPPGLPPDFPMEQPPSAGPGAQPPSGAPDPDAQREADSRVQQALRRALGELMQQFGELTGDVPPSLTEADKAMRESIGRLGQGQDKAASDAQQQAIQALQKGASEMGQTMARQFGRGRQGQDPGEDEGDGEGGMGMMMPDGNRDGGTAGPRPGAMSHASPEGRDPLGRYNHGSGTDNGDVTIPEERERQRAQAIQEELRRRGADRSRPQEELNYIDRLLKQF
jgi:tetratricopeptide (TPR) repeat protein